MTSQTEKAKARLNTLSSSLDDLDLVLEPLFAQSFQELTAGLEPIKQAKLQTVLPYLVYDLIFIYLKLRGIDPKTHPVVSELDRVKEYFNKISDAENPPKKNVEIDKDAAQRFIKHAITQASLEKKTDERPPPAPTSTARVEAKITSKMLARQLYEQALKEQDASGSEDELAVFGDSGNNDAQIAAEAETISPAPNRRAKGKAKETSSVESNIMPADPSTNGSKRKRPAIDPFAGYGDDESSPSLLSNPRVLDVQNSTSVRKRAHDDSETDVTSGLRDSEANTPDSVKLKSDISVSESGRKKKAKTKKRKKKPLTDAQ